VLISSNGHSENDVHSSPSFIGNVELSSIVDELIMLNSVCMIASEYVEYVQRISVKLCAKRALTGELVVSFVLISVCVLFRLLDDSSSSSPIALGRNKNAKSEMKK